MPRKELGPANAAKVSVLPPSAGVRPWSAPRPGERVGGYVVEELIGEGGMSLVYRARHAEIKRSVALKVLRPEFASRASELDRLLVEARAANVLATEHIVEVYDLGRDDAFVPPRAFMVMELLRGQTLAERIAARAALPLPEVLAIAKQLAAALVALHERQIIHRDIKPSNIFVDGEGAQTRVKVLDLGLVKTLDAEPSEAVDCPTRPGALLGTPEYMAPEQILGEPLDPRSDVYGFGLVLYEMLSGQRAFSGAPGAVLVQQLQDAPPPLSRAGDDSLASDELIRIAMRCLRKVADQRYQRTGELEQALAGISVEGDHRAGIADFIRSRHAIALGVSLAAVLGAVALIAIVRGPRMAGREALAGDRAVELRTAAASGQGEIRAPRRAASADGAQLGARPSAGLQVVNERRVVAGWSEDERERPPVVTPGGKPPLRPERAAYSKGAASATRGAGVPSARRTLRRATPTARARAPGHRRGASRLTAGASPKAAIPRAEAAAPSRLEQRPVGEGTIDPFGK